MNLYDKYNFLSEQLMPPPGDYDQWWIQWVANNWGGTLPDGSVIDVPYLIKGLSKWGEGIGPDGSSMYDTSNVSGSVNRNKKSSMTTTNEEAQMNFKDYLRQGLNEQSSDQDTSYVQFITWLLSQGYITNEVYLFLFEQLANGNVDIINNWFNKYEQEFLRDEKPDWPEPEVPEPGDNWPEPEVPPGGGWGGMNEQMVGNSPNDPNDPNWTGNTSYVMWNNGGYMIIRHGIAPDFYYRVIGPDGSGVFKSYQEAVNQLPAGVQGMGPGEIGPDPQAPDDKGDNMQMRSMPRMSPNKMPSFMIGGRSLNQGLHR